MVLITVAPEREWVRGLKGLKVWQRAKELAVDIYRITQKGDFSRDYGFKDQIRRAAVSIASNLAEGDERGSNKDAVRFFYIAKGSLPEINRFISDKQTLALIGIRRAGKSTLMFQLMEKLTNRGTDEKNLLYVKCQVEMFI